MDIRIEAMPKHCELVIKSAQENFVGMCLGFPILTGKKNYLIFLSLIRQKLLPFD